ncbi:MAG: signal peptide peptidase SppA [Pseudomonadota bacterium]
MKIIRAVFRWIWNVLKFSHTLVFGGLALLILILLLTGPFRREVATVPDGAALVLGLDGVVVEQLTEIDPFSLAAAGPSAVPREVLLADVKESIARAAKDERIPMLVLALDDFDGALPAALHEIAAAIDAFKAAGKPVVAYGDNYSQAQYFLASRADQVFMNPAGAVMMTGYGVYPLYFRQALEKLKLNTHVFRVGTYKSAVEPFLRDDMSPEDREAVMGFLTPLWNAYAESVKAARRDLAFDVSGRLGEVPALLRAAGGDLARMALDAGLVDGLMTRDETIDWLKDQVGVDDNDKSFRRIDMHGYLAATRKLQLGHQANRIAVVYAVGEIRDGEQPAGTVGGDTVSALIRKARLDDKVKAIVLRVDSPGGSAFASEMIRRELERAQADGKPVIASMGSVAASGGYWISATADEIWAQPTTITGSIGIFGILLTAEDGLGALGVHADGVGTTDLAGGYSPLRPLNPLIAEVVEQAIGNGYERFLSLVARGRKMTPQAVDAIAQGRVWPGITAKELGLVDAFGDLDAAVAAAAKRAGLEHYEKTVVAEEPSPLERLVRQFIEGMNAVAPGLARRPLSLEEAAWTQVKASLALPFAFNDPRGVYALCFECAAMARR